MWLLIISWNHSALFAQSIQNKITDLILAWIEIAALFIPDEWIGQFSTNLFTFDPFF